VQSAPQLGAVFQVILPLRPLNDSTGCFLSAAEGNA